MDSEALSGAALHTERASFMGAFPARGERAPYPGKPNSGSKFRILRYLFMRCKQFIIVSLAGVVLAASLAGCGGTAAPASSAAASSEPMEHLMRFLRNVERGIIRTRRG